MILLGAILVGLGAVFLGIAVSMAYKDYKKYKRMGVRYKNAEVLEFN